uniref:Uncharacterized protein n=1 Tax=Dromaius novaehollandiae TaxID=8790 RepID=A0A8C4PA45_DRONO
MGEGGLPPIMLTVYLGKRDFVDHIDVVDPVAESPRGMFSRMGLGRR